MLPEQASYWKTTIPSVFITLCVGGLMVLWLISEAVVLPFWSIPADANPLTFWFMVLVGVVTMTLSCAVALGGIFCLRRVYHEEIARERGSRTLGEKTAQSYDQSRSAST